MKNIVSFYAFMFFLLMLCSCSGDEVTVPDNEETEDTFAPTEIKFVFEDGTVITPGTCISNNDVVAIEITAVIQGSGNTPTQINYTVNGFIYSMTFSSAGSLRNPIDLFDGQNIAQIASTGQTTEIRFVKQDDFEEVF